MSIKWNKYITVSSTVGLITVVIAVVYTITLVAGRDTLPIGAGERVGATLQCGWLVGWIIQAGLLIECKLHAVRAATHTLGVRCRKTEVTAVSIRICWPVAEVGT